MPVGKPRNPAVNQGKASASNSQPEAHDELRYEREQRTDGPKADLRFHANSESPSTFLKSALFFRSSVEQTGRKAFVIVIIF
jgi:hypothetical protein